MAHFFNSWQPLWIIPSGEKCCWQWNIFLAKGVWGGIWTAPTLSDALWLSTNAEPPQILCFEQHSLLPNLLFSVFCASALHLFAFCEVHESLFAPSLFSVLWWEGSWNNGLPVSGCEDALAQLAQTNRKAVRWEGVTCAAWQGFISCRKEAGVPQLPVRSWLCCTMRVKGGTAEIPHSF